MLPITFIRENEKRVLADLDKRGTPERKSEITQVLKLDDERKKVQFDLDNLRKERNTLSKQIAELKKQNKDASAVLVKVKSIPEDIRQLEERHETILKNIHDMSMRLPNVLHDSVPKGASDQENKTVRTWGKPKKYSFELKPHGELAEEKGLADFKRAGKISGAGFNFLLGDLALLDLALQRFAIDTMIKKGYQLVIPPNMMRRVAYEGVTDLADFEKVMYKTENEDEYLIATSEHPLTARFQNEVLDVKDLPLKFVSISPCYRREIGAHGLDTKGLFRMHQFYKVEQIIICKPEDSWKFHEEIQKNAEALFKKLKIPFRVVNICTGDIGIVAAKKYDIEAWMPRENTFKEVTSCSNCTFYQAARLNIKYEEKGERAYVHTLNATAIATGRALRAILENYQQKDRSVKVPAVLVKYMNGKKVIGKK